MELAREAGFANVSIDLIIGLPTQTARSMEANFRVIEALQARPRLGLYPGRGPPPREPTTATPASISRRAGLLDLGFEHYEVSNFCRPGKASRHNLKYWRMAPYVGLGASAAGFLDGRDYRNDPDLKKYQASLAKGTLPEQKTRPLDPAKRRIITGLRLLAGIPASAFRPFPRRPTFCCRGLPGPPQEKHRRAPGKDPAAERDPGLFYLIFSQIWPSRFAWPSTKNEAAIQEWP